MRGTLERRRSRLHVDGVVQGVGFRPYVYRLARSLGLDGFVRNDGSGVLIEVEGPPSAVGALVARLPAEAPPLAAVERVREVRAEPTGRRGFIIADSDRSGGPDALVSPDIATCDDCLRELFDPRDRRFRYPFINCTNCGPRFTIVHGVPYDRALTTMAEFWMCERCAHEFADPADRRFHAQPNACPECGPRVRLVPDQPGGDPVTLAAAAVRDGAILAVKGVGGFHLACLAADEAAVALLRRRKHREEKPFALMVGDLEAARSLVELGERDEAVLCGHERPVGIAPRRAGALVAEAVAPRSGELGVMLPYSPLHHLLLADVGAPLVMTSGNVSDEPIAFEDEDALSRLAAIADLFLLHDRPIRTRTEDSVVRGRVLLRRSRGFVPGTLGLPVPASRHVLACGAELKSTFCVARGSRAWVGPHIGDLSNEETLRSFERGVAHFERLFAVSPAVVAHDLHPDYLSTSYALAREGVEHMAVQHHHAHLAACLAEHGSVGPAVGAIFDGTGLGPDGAVWGGELLVGDLREFTRAGHLWPARLPGGDQAVRQPWRMACAWLVAAGVDVEELPLPGVALERWRAVERLAESGVASPWTTSVGRLFDAVAALCGLRCTVTYEGQAAMELESACADGERGAYPLPLADGVLDARPAIRAVVDDVAGGVPAGVVASRFHNGLADATAAACREIAGEHGLGTVVLAGGVFQNRRLLSRTAAAVEAAGLRVLVPRRLPPNDGAIAYGQAAVAAARIAAPNPLGGSSPAAGSAPHATGGPPPSTGSGPPATGGPI